MRIKRSQAEQSSRQATAKKRVPQVAALPWRKQNETIEVLLVTSRTTRRWVIPKGGVMAHLVDMNAARQEALEEAGITGRMRRKPIGTYTYLKTALNGAAAPHAVKVFALEQLGKPGECGARPRFDRPDRNAELRRDLGLRELAPVGEPDQRALMLWKLLDRTMDAPAQPC